MAQQNIKQIKGASQGSVLFLGTNSVVSEDYNNLNWDQGTFSINGNLVTSGTINGIDIATDVAANTAKVTNATHTGDVTGDTALTIAAGAVDIPMLSASGTSDTTTFLGGDNVWNVALKSLTVGSSTFVSLQNVGTVNVPDITSTLSATGTPDSTTFLRGDNTWAIPSGGGGSTASFTLRNVSSADTFSTPDETINCTSNSFIVQLPTAVGIQGTTYTLVNSGTGSISLKGAAIGGGETINGSTTITLSTQYISRTVQSDGANWIIK